METAFCPTETEAVIADVRRRQIHVVARDIGDWLAGIVSSVEAGQVQQPKSAAILASQALRQAT